MAAFIPKYNEIIKIKNIEIIFIVKVTFIRLKISSFTFTPLAKDIPKSRFKIEKIHEKN